MTIEPERAILADQDALRRIRQALKSATNPLIRCALKADQDHLTEMLARSEAAFAAAHGI